jgi:hypothetical protein
MRLVAGPRKLAPQIVLSVAAVALPMALAALYFLVHGINNDIEVAELEIHGNAYQKTLEAPLGDIPAFARGAPQRRRERMTVEGGSGLAGSKGSRV